MIKNIFYINKWCLEGLLFFVWYTAGLFYNLSEQLCGAQADCCFIPVKLLRKACITYRRGRLLKMKDKFAFNPYNVTLIRVLACVGVALTHLGE